MVVPSITTFVAPAGRARVIPLTTNVRPAAAVTVLTTTAVDGVRLRVWLMVRGVAGAEMVMMLLGRVNELEIGKGTFVEVAKLVEVCEGGDGVGSGGGAFGWAMGAWD